MKPVTDRCRRRRRPVAASQPGRSGHAVRVDAAPARPRPAAAGAVAFVCAARRAGRGGQPDCSRFPPRAEKLQFALVFNLIPHALAPLAALLYATGIIQDEVEEQTLTYLLLRPLPRWAIYLRQAAGDALDDLGC